MLGYRAFSTVRDESRALDTALGQLHSWLRSKKYDADALTDGETADLAPGVTGHLTRLSGQDGSASVRARVVEETRDGDWTSELTVHEPAAGRGDPWLWLDVRGPERYARAAVPRLARGLLDVLAGHDGSARLAPTPQLVDATDLGGLVEAVTDPTRRGLVFVAGTSSDLPLQPWSELVAGILRETTGLAASYVLDAETTQLFTEAIGHSHEVRPGTVRTFLPGVVTGDELDARRHRILTTERIVRSNGRFLRQLLGDRARDATLEAPLPAAALRVDRRFRAQLDDQLLTGLRADEAVQAPVRLLPRPTTPVEDAPTVPLPPADDDTGIVAINPALLEAVLADVLGSPVVSPEALQQLGALARTGRRAANARDELAARIDALETQVDDAREAEAEMRSQRDDVLLDQELTDIQRADAERSVRYLRAELAKADRAEVAYGDVPTQEADEAPESFDDLLVRAQGLVHVVVTGDPDVTRGLDRHALLGTWARKTWEALLALEDYARESLADRCPRDVDAYLKNPPNGCRGYSGKHAARESGDVERNPRYSGPRTLPVPIEVDSSGRTYMGAHFKIALYGMVSPRMHYLDDTSRSGRIYVGHIGPHLPNSGTN